MINFRTMTDEQLNSWLDLYEKIPLSRILMNREDYIAAIKEAYFRFKGDEVYRYCYFVYLNVTGSYNDYIEWKNK